MRKTALVALASLPLLLGGCVAQVCDLPTVTINWTLQDTAGNPWTCAGAGVNQVDVFLGGLRYRYPCAAYGATIDVSGLAPGPHAVTVEGLFKDPVTGAETIYDRAQFNVMVGDCGNSTYYPALAEGLINLDYHFGTPGTVADTCYAAGSSIWFSLWDDVAGQVISGITTGSSSAWKTAYPCGGPTLVQFPVPYGSYTLLGIQEVRYPLSATPISAAQICGGAMKATVAAPGVTTLTPPYLAPPAPAAAVCYTGAALP